MEEPIFLPEEQEIIRKLEEELTGKEAVSHYDYWHQLEQLNNEKIEIIPVFFDEKDTRTWWYLVINKEKLKKQDNLEIEVPKQIGLEAIFRGKNSWQVQAWKKRLRISKLEVVGVWFSDTKGRIAGSN